MAPEPVSPESEVIVEVPSESMVAEMIAVETPVIAEPFSVKAPMVAKIAAIPIPPWSEIAMKAAVVLPEIAMEAPMIAALGELDSGACGPCSVALALRLGGGSGERERRERRCAGKQQLSHPAYSHSRASTARPVKTHKTARAFHERNITWRSCGV